jgi:hypothetical protein
MRLPRRVAVGLLAELERAGAAGEGAHVAHALLGPAGALALERLGQRRIAVVEIDVDEGRRLVGHLVGDAARAGVAGVHGRVSFNAAAV